MLEFGGDDEIRGPYADQPRLIKVGMILVFAASLDFLIFVPISVGMAVFAGVGEPAAAIPESGCRS
jgi:hypothetical protein